jgi:hypothetical protein
MAATTIGSSFTIDTHDYKDFARNLRRTEPLIAKSMRTKLRAAGAVVATEAKSIVGQSSSSIPPTVKVRTSGVSVSVIATGVLAGLFELGNKGSGGGGTFRHPVYGNMMAWASQPMHPFLSKALESKIEAVTEMVGVALDEAIKEATDF